MCTDELDEMFIKTLLEISAGNVFVVALGFFVGQQRRIKYDEARMRHLVFAAIVEKTDGERRVGDGAETSAAAATWLSSNDKIALSFIEVGIRRIREMPCLQDRLNDLGKIIQGRFRQVLGDRRCLFVGIFYRFVGTVS